MLQKNSEHQNGSRATLLGYPDQRTADRLSVKHRPILTDGCARIYVHGQASREMPVRVTAGPSTSPITTADAPNVVWAIDFPFDSMRCGTLVKLASMVDEHTCESILDMTNRWITSEKDIDKVEKIIAHRVAPLVLRCDNGPEFTSHALNEFAARQRGIHYIPLGQPWCNEYLESFKNRVRDECLKLNTFDHIYEARAIVGDWKEDYNCYHRHSMLGYLTPNECAQNCKCIHNSKTLK